MKRNVVFISISLVIILLLVIGVSYSLWNISVSQDTINTATTKCFNVEITGQKNSISLENAYPISNEKGKKLTPFSFTVTNTCDIFASYTISLESLKGTTLSSKFINTMINNEEIKKLSDYEITDTVNTGSIESHILAKGSLGSGDSEDYTLRVWIDYDTTMEDLDNETKTFKSKIVVKAQPSSWSPVDEGYTTLHDAILANEYQSSPEATIKKIEAKGTPDLSKTAPISADDLSDKGLYKSEDDYGNTYYYRGKVNNNNVYFAGFYWQIIRINGDSSIRLLYNGTEKEATGNSKTIGVSSFNSTNNSPTYIGYMYGNSDGTTFAEVHSNLYDSTIKIKLDDWYKINVIDGGLSNYISQLSGFCGDRKLFYGDGISSNMTSHFGAFERYGNDVAQFICQNTERDLYTTRDSNIGNKALTYPIGLITYDELVFAGMTAKDNNKISYVYSSEQYWTMSPTYYTSDWAKSFGWVQHSDGNLSHGWIVNAPVGARPIISLKSDVKISGGIGTINDPYVVE